MSFYRITHKKKKKGRKNFTTIRAESIEDAHSIARSMELLVDQVILEVEPMVQFKLKEYLEFTGTSINLLHTQTGIRYATIYDMINGRTDKINMVHLNKLMKALHIKDMNLVFELTS